MSESHSHPNLPNLLVDESEALFPATSGPSSASASVAPAPHLFPLSPPPAASNLQPASTLQASRSHRPSPIPSVSTLASVSVSAPASVSLSSSSGKKRASGNAIRLDQLHSQTSHSEDNAQVAAAVASLRAATAALDRDHLLPGSGEIISPASSSLSSGSKSASKLLFHSAASPSSTTHSDPQITVDSVLPSATSVAVPLSAGSSIKEKQLLFATSSASGQHPQRRKSSSSSSSPSGLSAPTSADSPQLPPLQTSTIFVESAGTPAALTNSADTDILSEASAAGTGGGILPGSSRKLKEATGVSAGMGLSANNQVQPEESHPRATPGPRTSIVTVAPAAAAVISNSSSNGNGNGSERKKGGEFESKKSEKNIFGIRRRKKEAIAFSLYINDVARTHFGVVHPNNVIKTSKYTWWNFLFKNLFEQFRRFANLYFLVIVVLQSIKEISPFPVYTSLIPLVFILGVSAIKEGIEDYRRHTADDFANSRVYRSLIPDSGARGEKGRINDLAAAQVEAAKREGMDGLERAYEQQLADLPYLEMIPSKNIEVGQILKIERNEEFPADMILLSSSSADGTCYVNTANLDGEAVPKVRTSPPATMLWNEARILRKLRGVIECEPPNASLYHFQGTLLLTRNPDVPDFAAGAVSSPSSIAHNNEVKSPHDNGTLALKSQQSSKEGPIVRVQDFSESEEKGKGAAAVDNDVDSTEKTHGHLLVRQNSLQAAAALNAQMNADEYYRQKQAVGDSQLLLRGAKLVNTDCVYGIVCYTGGQTKMMLNRNPARFKFSHFERSLNRLVVYLFIFNFIVCVTLAACYVGFNQDFEKQWQFEQQGGVSFILNFFTQYILYSFMIPMSLYVTIEIVKVGQAQYMEWDIRMQVEKEQEVGIGAEEPKPVISPGSKSKKGGGASHSNTRPNEITNDYGKTFLRMSVKSSTLNEELGSVEFIFSDKTGTLTQNKMELSATSCNGMLYVEANSTSNSNNQTGPPPATTIGAAGTASASGSGIGHVVEPSSAGDHERKESRGPAIGGRHDGSNADMNRKAVSSTSDLVKNAFEDDSRFESDFTANIEREFLLDILLCNGVLPSRTFLDDNSYIAETDEEDAQSNATASGNPLSAQRGSDGDRLVVATTGGKSGGGSSGYHAPLQKRASISHMNPPLGKKEHFVFQSQSPDEVALLEAVHRCGLIFTNRVGKAMHVRYDPKKIHPMALPMERQAAKASSANAVMRDLEFTLVANLEFTSTRARMSVVVRDDKQRYKLYVKGADSAILKLLNKKDVQQQRYAQQLSQQVAEFAARGSRTLVMAGKELSSAEWKAWESMYQEASTALDGREDKIESAFKEIEKDLYLLGCTAVEDQLQDGVPQAIEMLLDAGIKVMVLTGDKQETAVTIAYQSRLLQPHMKLFYVKGITKENAEKDLQAALKEIEEMNKQLSNTVQNGRSGLDEKTLLTPIVPSSSLVGNTGKTSFTATDSGANPVKSAIAMAIDGLALETCLIHHEELFFSLFTMCETIVSFRSTPRQKALAVRIVKNRLDRCCLAIGDGANDVSMIQESHVGIGILGKEGSHAAMSADFVIHRFAHLIPLLFVHGRHNFYRTAMVVFFCFYKNMAMPFPQVLYSFWSASSGQVFYIPLMMSTFNLFLSSLPPLVVGVFDKDLATDVVLSSPKAYQQFRDRSVFTQRNFFLWMAEGIYHGLVLWFVLLWTLSPTDVITSDGLNSDITLMGVVLLWAVVWVLNIKMTTSQLLTYWSVGAGILGIAAYVTVLGVLSTDYSFWITLTPTSYYMINKLFDTNLVWLFPIICIAICLLPLAILQSVCLLMGWKVGHMAEMEVFAEEVRAANRRKGEAVEIGQNHGNSINASAHPHQINIAAQRTESVSQNTPAAANAQMPANSLVMHNITKADAKPAD